MDSFLLQHLGGANALPCGGDFDEDPVAANAGLVVLGNDAAGLGKGGLGVIREAGIHFGRNAAGNDGENFLAKGDGQFFESQVGHVGIGCLRAQFLARFKQDTVHDRLVLRHLGRAGNQRGISG